MGKFNIGDKVLCINRGDTDLIEGKIYIISDVNHIFVRLDGGVSSYYEGRFLSTIEIRKLKIKKCLE